MKGVCVETCVCLWASPSLIIGPHVLTLLKLPLFYNGFHGGSDAKSGITVSLYLHLRSQ